MKPDSDDQSLAYSDAPGLNKFLQRHSLSIFFVLVFALTWPFLIADALGSHGHFSFRLSVPLMLVMSYMPTVAALVMTAALGGTAAVRELLGRLLRWRVGVGWYLVAIFGFAAVCLLAVWLGNAWAGNPEGPLLGPDAAKSSAVQLLIMVPLLFMVTGLVNGEEIAWRGFALPRLQGRWNALVASILLGLVWSLFHLPLFFTLGSPLASTFAPLYVLQTVSVSIIFTWVFNNTRGSLLLAYLLHAAINTWTRVLPIENAAPQVGYLTVALLCLSAGVIVWVYGAENLSKHGARFRQ